MFRTVPNANDQFRQNNSLTFNLCESSAVDLLSMKRPGVKLFLLIASLTILSTEASANVIYSVTGSNPSLSCLGINCFSQVLMASWTSTVDYDNVSIAVEIGTDDPTATISAFLTTQIGLGTTAAADELAAVTLAPPSTDSVETLFTGASLPAGTYYLVLSGPAAGSSAPYWYSFDTPTVTTGIGVTAGDPGVANLFDGTVNSLYAPASIFDTANPIFPAILVAGTPVANTPEPPSWLLLVVGLALCAFSRRWTIGTDQ
jgi:hypothetical protein